MHRSEGKKAEEKIASQLERERTWIDSLGSNSIDCNACTAGVEA